MTNPHHPAWLQQRDGESRDEWINRTNRSCYWCPIEPFPDAVAASAHEDQCERNPHVKRRTR